MWMFDEDYIIQNNNSYSYVQALAMLCVFSTIVLSYTIYVKGPHEFV